MKQLANFSIEGDGEVLLVFQDGTKLRVPKDQLATVLTGPDLQRVQASFRHRKWFMRNILPPWARSVAIAVVTLAVAAGGIKAVSSEIKPSHPATTRATPSAPAATRVAVAATRTPASPSATPVPTTGVLAAETTPAPTLLAHTPTATPQVNVKLENPVPNLVKHVLSPVTSALGALGL
ncbi:MAG TPA: hypothetical protein VGH44_01120 [Candidatus Saccharimonadia bacterium]|jgi:hypothetical protein